MEASDFAPKDWRECRRLQALQLKQYDWYQRDIAEALGVSEVSVSRWLARARTGGAEALLARPIPGRPPDLSEDQKQRIPEFLWHGLEAYGFRGRVWTCARVGRVIEEEFGVAYHKSHVSRLLKELAGRRRRRFAAPSNGTKKRSNAGVNMSGRSCCGRLGGSAGR